MDDVDGCGVLDELAAGCLDADAVGAALAKSGLSDGLPIVAPTPDKLAAMTSAFGSDPNEVVVDVPPLRGSLTARRLAVCAVLAGCVPLHAPVVAAVSRSLVAPELNALGVLTTTSSAALMVVVNGPIRHVAGFNGGANCLGPGCASNAVVGRTLSMVTRIVGGAREGVADMATMGQPAKFGFCFAENEEGSPWRPLHEDRGQPPGTSAVTVVGVGGTIEAFDPATVEPAEMIRALAAAIVGGSPVVDWQRRIAGGGHQSVLISPEWAGIFAAAALSKQDLKAALFEDGERIAGRPIAETHDDVMVIVAGGVGIKQTVVPGWAGASAPVTVAV